MTEGRGNGHTKLDEMTFDEDDAIRMQSQTPPPLFMDSGFCFFFRIFSGSGVGALLLLPFRFMPVACMSSSSPRHVLGWSTTEFNDV